MRKHIVLLAVMLTILSALFVSCTLDPVKEQAFTYITFKSDAPFTVTPSYSDGKAVWNGTLQYSAVVLDQKAWKPFKPKKETVAAAVYDGTCYVLYVRGVDNTVVSAYGNGWTIQATDDVTCTGNIMSLLNCLNMDSATMGTDCFASMFDGWTHLVTVPALPQTNLSSGCYRGMFKGCSSLCIEEVPEGGDPKKWWVEKIIKVTTADQASSMAGMFENCSSDSIMDGDVSTGNTYCFFASEEPQWKPYLTFSSDSAFTLKILIPNWTATLQYCTDPFNGEWTDLVKYQYPSVAADYNETMEKYVVYLRGKNTQVCNTNEQTKSFDVVESGVLVDCSGNIMTLLDYEDPDNANMFYNHALGGVFCNFTQLRSAPELPATELKGYCYHALFYGCTNLLEAPELPATVLADSCYYSMFGKCTSLTEAPELPEMDLASRCYGGMFSGCSSLATAPELPATVMANSCYSGMFSRCVSLQEAPLLPSTTLADYCYDDMFRGCSSLTEAPVLPATTLAKGCYSGMFGECTSLEQTPELPATVLAPRCYSSMFHGCTGLRRVTAFPTIQTYGEGCLIYMFHSCSGLRIEEVACGGTPTMTGATYFFTPGINNTYMFYKCSSESITTVYKDLYSMCRTGYDFYWF